jgi:hypothetical protein
MEVGDGVVLPQWSRFVCGPSSMRSFAWKKRTIEGKGRKVVGKDLLEERKQHRTSRCYRLFKVNRSDSFRKEGSMVEEVGYLVRPNSNSSKMQPSLLKSEMSADCYHCSMYYLDVSKKDKKGEDQKTCFGSRKSLNLVVAQI